MQSKTDVGEAIITAGGALFSILRNFQKKAIENERLSLASVLLLKSISFPSSALFNSIAETAVSEQKEDGGWVGVEDTAWRVALLGFYKKYDFQCNKGSEWLKGVQLYGGGWGKSSRDRARIPVTGNLLFLLPDIAGRDKALDWMEEEIKMELQNSPVLSYKLAFYLLAVTEAGKDSFNVSKKIVEEAAKRLVELQDVSGGWGYCANHPVGPTPFCTALGLAALTGYWCRENNDAISKGADWLLESQNPNGLWPEHYIEEGSAWALFSLNRYYKLIAE